MLIRALKLSFGAMIGTLIAYFLGLSHPLTAGVIVLLSLGKTKRSSIEIARVRIKAVALALVLASVLFFIFGFTVYAFSLFLFTYIPLILIFKLEEGLVIGSVLSTHLIIAASSGFGILFNTLSLFVIGVGIAMLVNLYMPDMRGEIIQDQRYIEERFRDILLIMATMIKGNQYFDQSMFVEIETFINDALVRAKMNADNYLRADMSYYANYMNMRKMQFEILKRMFNLTCQIEMELVQAALIADLTKHFAHSLSESNSGEGLLEELAAVLAECQDGTLPKSRQEFENRAILFQYLSEFRHMVELKREFNEKQKELFKGSTFSKCF
ncbi:MAG: aromatic acid exporter family protein [Defluviitaleaceae bacterium]|nr:aromatic acid exporter family protein [Defluviitaleaceae bacterium]